MSATWRVPAGEPSLDHSSTSLWPKSLVRPAQAPKRILPARGATEMPPSADPGSAAANKRVPAGVPSLAQRVEWRAPVSGPRKYTAPAAKASSSPHSGQESPSFRVPCGVPSEAQSSELLSKSWLTRNTSLPFKGRRREPCSKAQPEQRGAVDATAPVLDQG